MDGARGRSEEAVRRLRADSLARLGRARPFRRFGMAFVAGALVLGAFGLERWRGVRELERLRTTLRLKQETECAEHERRRAAIEEYGARRLGEALGRGNAAELAQVARGNELDRWNAWRLAARDGCYVEPRPLLEDGRPLDRLLRGGEQKWFDKTDFDPIDLDPAE